jgi:hypothetical protein
MSTIVVTTEAQRHLARAKRYVASADQNYRRAAEEIIAARDADPSLSLRAIDRALGKSNGYSGALVRWYTAGGSALHPFVKESGRPFRSPSGGDDEWYTRPEFVDAARGVLGGIDLDPASCKVAQRTVRARRYFTKEDDGLTREWHGRVWINPPFSVAGKFGAKLLREFDAGNVTSAIMVVNAYSADTRWFQPFWNFPVCVATRPAFYKPDHQGNPMVWAAFVYLGREFDSFVGAFSQLGKVVKDPTDRAWERRWSQPPSRRSD